MSKVPAGWGIKTLGVICNGQLQTGPFGSQLYSHEYTENGIPVLMPRDLINCRADLTNAAKIPLERAMELKRHTLKKGDLLFSRRGDVARFALIEGNSIGALCGTGCLKASPTENYSSEFLVYCLQLDTVKTWLEHNAVGQTMLNMNTSILSKLPLFISTNKFEQEKIAQILSTWDKAIATTEQLIGNSQQQKKALMQSLLTGKKRLPGFEKSNEYQTTRYGKIPLDWGFKQIDDIAKNISIKNKEGKDYPVLSCSKHSGFIDSLKYFNKKVYSDNTDGYKIIKKGWFGFPSNHIEEGSIGLQDLYEVGIVSPIYIIFGVNEKFISSLYLYALFKTDHYKQIFSASTNASVDRRGSLRWDEFGKIKVPVPPLPEQQKIAAVLTAADNEIELLQKKLAFLKQEKTALMQQLLTGKRRVKVEAA